jgi:periplasmic protein TonB
VPLRVMIDETGVPRDSSRAQPGLGLDQKAIEAVKNWRFKPGTTKHGQPVRVAANIETSFRL